MRHLSLLLPLLAACATSNVGSEPTGVSPEIVAFRDADPSRIDVRLWAEASDAVVLGRVTGIRYTMSLPASDRTRFPFTFVTVAVEKAWSGAKAGDTLTLRLFGGPTPDGGLLLNSEQPIFQVGDRDVLFVSLNDVGAVPFIRGSHTRLRLVEGATYSNEGDAILLGQGGLTLGAWHELPQLNVVDIGGILREQNVDRIADPAAAPGISEDALVGLLDRELAGLPGRPQVVSADPARPVDFDIPGMIAREFEGDTRDPLAATRTAPLATPTHK
jgi:hypothetical protein